MVDEGITFGDLKGTLELARGDLRPRRQTRFRPDFFPFTEPSVEVDVSCFACGGAGRLDGGERDPLCKGTGWLEILGGGMVDPNVFGFVAADTIPSAPGLRVRDGHRADRDAQAQHPRPAHLLRERRALPGAVLDEGSLRLAARVLRSRAASPRRSPSCSRCARSRSNGSTRIGAPSTDGFVVGRVVSAETAPERRPAPGLRGRYRRRRADDRLRRAERRRRPDGAGRAPGRACARRAASSSKAKLRGVESDGMILSEDELGAR